jgi:hypothetical protein
MTSSNDFPQHLPLLTHNSADPFTSGFDVYAIRSKSLDTYLSYALQALAEHDQILPDMDRLTLIVNAALSSQSLFFAASMHDPEPLELHRFFEMFVLACVILPEKWSTL